MELPINNYIYLTASGVNKFVNEMENGVTIELPESVSYTDENGIKSTLSAGKTTLTAGQTTAVLAHSKWKSSENAASVATSITASLFNGYMTTDHSLKGYFGVLSNVAQTNLRIDNYTAYASALNHLAECNTGDVAAIVQLDGETENGLFIPDVDACRHNSGFYHE